MLKLNVNNGDKIEVLTDTYWCRITCFNCRIWMLVNIVKQLFNNPHDVKHPPIIHHKSSSLNLETSATKKRWAEDRTCKSHWPINEGYEGWNPFIGRNCLDVGNVYIQNDTNKFWNEKMMKPAALTWKTNFLKETLQPALYTFHRKLTNKWSAVFLLDIDLIGKYV